MNSNDDNCQCEVRMKYDVSNVPEEFMRTEAVQQKIQSICDNIESGDLDDIYGQFCSTVQQEMKQHLPCIKIRKPDCNKKRRVKKPWWNDELSKLWNDYVAAERKWRKCKYKEKQCKATMKCKQRDFDRAVQKAKRKYWYDRQQDIVNMFDKSNSKDFWKHIGTLGVGKDRKVNIPFEIVKDDGTVTKNKDEVLSHWADHYRNLLNPDVSVDSNVNVNEQHVPKSPNNVLASDELYQFMDCPITWGEISEAIRKAKLGKATGYDELPLEALRNDIVKYYLVALFNKCFDSGLIPSIWSMGLIVPIPKCFTKDNRIPSNTRGITLASAVYKLYCSILNTRLVTFDNKCMLTVDEQNGFRKGRSCVDHLFSLSSIVEARQLSNRSTYVAYIDFSKAYDSICREKLWYKLEKLGLKIDSKYFTALKSLYNDVKCAVKLNNQLSSWFDVNVGLKQGCLLSPVLFNLYVNDLACKIKSLNIGVRTQNDNISILMYADDLVFLAESESDLQMMLDTLNEWCITWGMNVNEQKTKVMHFRKKGKACTKVNFNCGNKTIDVCSQYKYLGLMIDEYLDYNVTAKHVSKSAHRALGLLIAKDKAQGGFSYDIFTRLYDVMVNSIIEYGAAIWGQKSYSCINAVQNRASRYFLGLGKRAPNLATQGDIGWRLPEDRQWLCIVRHWLRLCNMNDTRMCKKVFQWCKMHASLRTKNWIFRCETYFKRMDLRQLLNIDCGITCDQIKQVLISSQNAEREKKWLEGLNREKAKQGTGGNKLRVYRSFKQYFRVENYVKMNMSKKYRKAIAMFRAGVAPINVELMRYGPGSKPVNERKCFVCKDNVEDECHVITQCPLYADIREHMFHQISSHDARFNELSSFEKLCYVMSDDGHIRTTAKACYDILQRRKCILTL